MTVVLTGIETVMTNLNAQIIRIEKKTMEGLILSAMAIWKKTQPMVPVDLGNLRSSFFITTATQTEEGDVPSFTGEKAGEMEATHAKAVTEAKALAGAAGGKPVVVLGFSANYAWYIHENTTTNYQKPKKGKSRRPMAQAKFLEKGIKESIDDVITILTTKTSTL